MPGDAGKKPGPLRRITSRMGRGITALSIPYIMLGYPIAGYLIGLGIQKIFHLTPPWTPIIVMMMALVQAFREVVKIATQVAVDDEKDEKENGPK